MRRDNGLALLLAGLILHTLTFLSLLVLGAITWLTVTLAAGGIASYLGAGLVAPTGGGR